MKRQALTILLVIFAFVSHANSALAPTLPMFSPTIPLMTLPAAPRAMTALTAPLEIGRFQLPFRSREWPAIPRHGNFAALRSYGWHDGIDFAVPVKTPVYASRAGVVIRADPFNRRFDFGRGYGGLVVIRHADGAETWYAHLYRIYVKVGQKVTHETRIGLSGGKNNGSSSGPHLHFRVVSADGTPLNPSLAFATEATTN